MKNIINLVGLGVGDVGCNASDEAKEDGMGNNIKLMDGKTGLVHLNITNFYEPRQCMDCFIRKECAYWPGNEYCPRHDETENMRVPDERGLTATIRYLKEQHNKRLLARKAKGDLSWLSAGISYSEGKAREEEVKNWSNPIR